MILIIESEITHIDSIKQGIVKSEIMILILFKLYIMYKPLVHTQPGIILYYQACILYLKILQQKFVLASKILSTKFVHVSIL